MAADGLARRAIHAAVRVRKGKPMMRAMPIGWAMAMAIACCAGAAGRADAQAQAQTQTQAQAQAQTQARTQAVAKPAPSAMAPAPAKKPSGAPYLGPGRLPDAVAILPPPPVKGSPDDQRDRAVYAATRRYVGTPRGDLAATDSVRYIAAFDCALGVKLEDGPPEVLAVLGRAGRDASTVSNRGKDHYKIPRPFIGNTDPICVEKDRTGLTGSPSYPSGHATFSWTAGLILAELAPERATAILARARAFGESRVVCGVHTVSDIEAGRTLGASLVAVLHSDPEFRADMEKARLALQSAMARPHAVPDPAQCKGEADAMTHTPWINPDTDK